jgi:hypothetical protein
MSQFSSDRLIHYLLVHLALFLSVTVAALCQDPAAGIIPFSTQAASGYESIDLATGNIFVSIPVKAKSGKIPFSYTLSMNTGAYWTGYRNQGGAWVDTWTVGTIAGLAPFLPFSANVGYTHTGTLSPEYCNGTLYSRTAASGFYITDSTGVSHPLSSNAQLILGLPAACANSQFTAQSDDYTLHAWAQDYNAYLWTVYDRSGNIISNSTPTIAIQDPDGAEITSVWTNTGGHLIDTYTDTLGQTALVSNYGQYVTPDSVQYNDAAGNTQIFQVNRSTFTLQTAYGCSIQEMGPIQRSLPSSVTTPNGPITFVYEITPGDTHNPHYTTGRLAKITYPTGGSTSYTYSGGSNNSGVYCGSNGGVPPGTGVVPTLTKTVNDGSGNLSTWTYANSRATTAFNFTVTVTDPAQNQTVYNFSGEFQTQAQYYQGPATGTPLKTVVTCYNQNYSSKSACVTPTAQVYGAAQTDIYTYLGTSTAPSLVETKRDSYGNTSEIKQFDFGATYPPSNSYVSDTLTSYGQAWISNSNSCNPYPDGTYIFNTPCYSHTKNSSGADIAKTQITYSLTGHPTSIAKWTGGSSWLTSAAMYNTNGTLQTATDVNGTTVSTYGYTGVCNGMLPTSVTVTGPGLPSG